MFAVFRIAAVGAALAGLPWPPATAAATPATGVSARILTQTRVGGTGYIVREITLQPGGEHRMAQPRRDALRGGAQRHSHPHPADCTTTEVSPAGSTLVEASAHVHIGRNLGAGMTCPPAGRPGTGRPIPSRNC
jgi:hypothetical protein